MSKLLDVSYFPGCSLESSARESNLALLESAKLLGLNLIELEDWNCCGASSAKVLDKDIAYSLAARNLSLAPPDRPLTATCPVCLSRLREAQQHLREDPEARQLEERHWRRQIPWTWRFSVSWSSWTVWAWSACKRSWRTHLRA